MTRQHLQKISIRPGRNRFRKAFWQVFAEYKILTAWRYQAQKSVPTGTARIYVLAWQLFSGCILQLWYPDVYSAAARRMENLFLLM